MPILGNQEIPLMGIVDAAATAKKLALQFKSSSFDKATLITALGYKGKSGSSGVAVGDLRKYGLVEGGSQQLRVTELAQRLALPTSPAERVAAYIEMAGNVPLYRQLGEHYKDRIPSEEEFFVSLIQMTGANRATAQEVAGRIYRSLNPVWSMRPGGASPSAPEEPLAPPSSPVPPKLEDWAGETEIHGSEAQAIEVRAGPIHMRYPLSESGIELLRITLQGTHFWDALRSQLPRRPGPPAPSTTATQGPPVRHRGSK